MRPAARVADVAAYRVPAPRVPLDLDLRGNEGARPSAELFATLAGRAELLRSYPDSSELEAALAMRLGVDRSQVLVTAGADDALDRTFRALVDPGRAVVIPAPAFAMTTQYARLAGATVCTVPWRGSAFPARACLAAAPSPAVIVVTSPNNPTGAVATAADLAALSRGAPDAVVLVDLAYAEYADEDLTAAALELPNTVVLRTMSKARGLAGLRVGYAVGPARVIGWLRAAGAPYAVSGPSLALALARLDADVAPHVERVRDERRRITAALTAGGADVVPSQANFVFARLSRPDWLADGLAGLGIGVRRFPDAIRIGCPDDAAATARVVDGIRAVMEPEALLLDMDGVLVDVRDSYREAIRRTCADLGVTVTTADIAEVKAAGDANNDWVVTQRLLARAGIGVSLERARDGFEGHMATLWQAERPLVPQAVLAALAERLPLAVVTGRPRADAERALDQHGLRRFVQTCVCLEDAPAKPSPAPVRLALRRLGVRAAWMVGDTPDDVRAARVAGVVPVGCPAPGEDSAESLREAGAGWIVEGLEALLEAL